MSGEVDGRGDQVDVLRCDALCARLVRVHADRFAALDLVRPAPGCRPRRCRGAVGLGVFAICVALAVVNVQSVLTTWWGLQSVLSGGMLGLFLLGFFAKRTPSAHAAVATVLGIMTVLWITFAPKLLDIPVFLHINLAIVFGTVVLVLSGFSLRLIGRVLVG